MNHGTPIAAKFTSRLESDFFELLLFGMNLYASAVQGDPKVLKPPQVLVLQSHKHKGPEPVCG